METRVRIGIDVRKLGDFGIGEYVRHLIASLPEASTAADGRPIDYVLFGRGREGPPEAGQRRWVTTRSPGYSLREQLTLPFHAWREKLDLLHVPHYAVPAISHCPLVVTIHDLIHLVFSRDLSILKRLYARTMMRIAAARARRIITDSDHARRDVIELLGVAPEKVISIPIGLSPLTARVDNPDTLRALRAQLGFDGPFLLTVGNVRMRHKNLTMLIEAFAIVLRKLDPALRLVIVGGAAPDYLRAKIDEELGRQANQVIILGYCSPRRLLALYTAAEVFVWPSLYEGFGLPPLEAMACGTPVVSSNTSSMPEVLGDAAVLIPPDDPQRFAEAVVAVLADTEGRGERIERGLANVARFDWPTCARKTLDVYREVLAEGARKNGVAP